MSQSRTSELAIVTSHSTQQERLITRRDVEDACSSMGSDCLFAQRLVSYNGWSFGRNRLLLQQLVVVVQ